MFQLSLKPLALKSVHLLLLLGSAFPFAWGNLNPAWAQESTQQDSVQQDSVVLETGAQTLKIPSRLSIQHSSSSAGFDGLTSLSGFIPLEQLSGAHITFIEGDVLLDNGANLGWSLSLGHRGYSSQENRVRGGHIGIDGRSTDESTFYQLAAGYESLGDQWDVRFNGYLPIGETTNTIRDVNFDSGLQTSTAFQSNQLVLSAIRERQRILQEEEALGGFDAEVGTKLSRWNGGELTGAIGGYLLTGEETSLGGQLRLSANFKSNFNAGVAVQHDGIFGTNLVVSLGASLPNLRFQKQEEQKFQTENEVAIRLRDPLHRRSTVAVQSRNKSEISFESTTAALKNPEEEQEYRFLHVDLAKGAVAGDGTYENPLGTVEAAIALINSNPNTYSDGNTIVYVDGESALSTTIPGFVLPDRVSILSQGPQQTIAGMSFPGFPTTPTRLPFSAQANFNIPNNSAPKANGVAVLLPDSGDNVFPVITGGANADLVTLGNSTVLAGFQIQNASQHGVTASNVNNVELRNNAISGSGGNGIFLDDVGGSATLFDNTVTGSGDRGIFARNTQTNQSLDVAIAGYDLNNNRVGMEFAAIASTTGPQVPAQIIAIGPSLSINTSSGLPGGTALTNSVLNSTDEGILVQATGDALLTSATQEFTFDQGTIDGSGGAGLSVLANVGAHVQEVNVRNSAIANNGGAGIQIVNGTPPAGATVTAASQELIIRNNRIDNNGGAGIDVAVGDASSQELVIRGNQITNNAGGGINSIARNVAIQEWRTDSATGDAGINENTITGNGGEAIAINAQDLAILPIVSVVNNEISGGGSPDVAIATTSTPSSPGTPTACAVISGNRLGGAIRLTGVSTVLSGGLPTFQVQDLLSLSNLNNGTPVVFSSNLLGTVTTPDTAPFSNETGGCIQ